MIFGGIVVCGLILIANRRAEVWAGWNFWKMKGLYGEISKGRNDGDIMEMLRGQDFWTFSNSVYKSVGPKWICRKMCSSDRLEAGTAAASLLVLFANVASSRDQIVESVRELYDELISSNASRAGKVERELVDRVVSLKIRTIDIQEE